MLFLHGRLWSWWRNEYRSRCDGNRCRRSVTMTMSVFLGRWRRHRWWYERRRFMAATMSVLARRRRRRRDKRGRSSVAFSVAMFMLGWCGRDHRRQRWRGRPAVSSAVFSRPARDRRRRDDRLRIHHPSATVVFNPSGRERRRGGGDGDFALRSVRARELAARLGRIGDDRAAVRRLQQTLNLRRGSDRGSRLIDGRACRGEVRGYAGLNRRREERRTDRLDEILGNLRDVIGLTCIQRGRVIDLGSDVVILKLLIDGLYQRV